MTARLPLLTRILNGGRVKTGLPDGERERKEI